MGINFEGLSANDLLQLLNAFGVPLSLWYILKQVWRVGKYVFNIEIRLAKIEAVLMQNPTEHRRRVTDHQGENL
jgi:hypothetical protein